jgi:hypothetical protein
MQQAASSNFQRAAALGAPIWVALWTWLLHVKAAARFLRTELLRSFQEDCETSHDDDDDDDDDKFRKCGSWDRGKKRASERARGGARWNLQNHVDFYKERITMLCYVNANVGVYFYFSKSSNLSQIGPQESEKSNLQNQLDLKKAKTKILLLLLLFIIIIFIRIISKSSNLSQNVHKSHRNSNQQNQLDLTKKEPIFF